MNEIYLIVGAIALILIFAICLYIFNKQITQKVSEEFSKISRSEEERNSQDRLLLIESIGNIKDSVNSHLMDGFKNNSEMLAKISGQSQGISSVVDVVRDLQKTLNDKQLRGSWGEKQLEFILENSIPDEYRMFQHTYGNGSRVDAAIKMPSGLMLSVDSKFPLDNFKSLMDVGDKASEKLFKQDIKKHVDDISSKYIINGETEDKAVMFIPSESIFISLNNDYYDLINYANKKKVWLASPSTLALIMSNVNHLISDEKTRKNIAKVKNLLNGLSDDLGRLEQRISQSVRLSERSTDDLKSAEVSVGKVISKINKIIDL